MKIKREQVSINSVFIPGVRFKTRNGINFEVIDTFNGIIAECVSSGEILEKSDFDDSLRHKKYSSYDIVNIDVHLEIDNDAWLEIDDLRGAAVLRAAADYAGYLNLCRKISDENLFKHARLNRAIFDAKTGAILYVRGFEIANLSDENLIFIREIERLKK